MRAAALACLVVAVLAVGWRWGSYVAGGSDSYCYFHQAERWASGRLQVVEPLALEAPWPDAPLTFAPAGHRPSPTVPGAIVPMCPSGLSMLMAPALVLGGPPAAGALIPLCGALLLLATFGVGARYGTRVGLASSLLAACSPAFLYQLVQPMSDVPAAACWMLAVLCATGTAPRQAVAAGLAASVAILIRPNLVPLGCVLGLFLLLRPERTWRHRLESAGAYAVCAGVGCIGVALIQQALYGSPISSGYGPFALLFSFDHVMPNAARYLSWLGRTQTPAIVLAGLAPFVLPGALTRLLAGMIAMNLALYLPYLVFDDWSSLRFLLPTLPLALIMMAAVADTAWRRLRVGHTAWAMTALVLALSVVTVREARDRHAFRLRDLEARFERVGTFVSRRLPSNAIVITSAYSGSARFYGQRRTLVWDALDPAWLDRAIAFVTMRGLEPFLLIDAGEESAFRRRFIGSPVAALDWPPMAQVASRARLYVLSDREKYRQGAGVSTEYAP